MPEQHVTIAVTPVMLDRERMAAALCISTDTLDGLRKRGLPCVPLPGSTKVLFEPGEVVAWLKEHREPQVGAERAARARADARFGDRAG